MLTYDKATEMLRNRNSKKIGNNTYLERIDERTVGVRLHSTHVVTIDAEDNYTLNAGGYETATTKDRINTYSPARVYAEQHVWYVDAPGLGSKAKFTSGMVVRATR